MITAAGFSDFVGEFFSSNGGNLALRVNEKKSSAPFGTWLIISGNIHFAMKKSGGSVHYIPMGEFCKSNAINRENVIMFGDVEKGVRLMRLFEMYRSQPRAIVKPVPHSDNNEFGTFIEITFEAGSGLLVGRKDGSVKVIGAWKTSFGVVYLAIDGGDFLTVSDFCKKYHTTIDGLVLTSGKKVHKMADLLTNHDARKARLGI